MLRDQRASLVGGEVAAAVRAQARNPGLPAADPGELEFGQSVRELGEVGRVLVPARVPDVEESPPAGRVEGDLHAGEVGAIDREIDVHHLRQPVRRDRQRHGLEPRRTGDREEEVAVVHDRVGERDVVVVDVDVRHEQELSAPAAAGGAAAEDAPRRLVRVPQQDVVRPGTNDARLVDVVVHDVVTACFQALSHLSSDRTRCRDARPMGVHEMDGHSLDSIVLCLGWSGEIKARLRT